MKEYVVRAPAKVNLSLDVIGKRPDGYHEMRMVNHSVALSDILVFKENGQRIAVSCSDPKIPTDARNLVHRVAEKLQARFGIDRGVQIDIQKNIPSEAGLAGGSADAAAAILGPVSYTHLRRRKPKKNGRPKKLKRKNLNGRKPSVSKKNEKKKKRDVYKRQGVSE